MTTLGESGDSSHCRLAGDKGRAVSVYCWLQACAAASFMLCALRDATCGWWIFVALQIGATIGLARPVPWRQHPSAARTSLAVALGFFVTWLAMHLTVVRYDEAPEQILWQFQYGDRRTGREEEVRVAPVVAGFPLWGVGGSDGERADRLVARWDLPPIPPPDIIWGSFWSPLHMKLERGLGLLWGNWVILTLVCFLASLALPTWMLVRLRLPAALLGWPGLGWVSLGNPWMATTGSTHSRHRQVLDEVGWPTSRRRRSGAKPAGASATKTLTDRFHA